MRRAVVFTIAALLLGACSIQPDAIPHDIPAERTAVFGEPATGGEAAGTSRIFLLAPPEESGGQSLRSVLRDVPATATDVLTALFAGPNVPERDAQMSTTIPSDAVLLSARRSGQVLTVDMNDVLGDLDPSALRLAVAQIVVTATELDGIESVLLRVDGRSQVWSIASGELTDRPLTRFDFPGVVESTQPPFPAFPTQGA